MVGQYEVALKAVLEDVVRPEAARVDQEGSFPRRSVDALRQAGLLHLTVGADVGGGGGDLGAARTVIEALARVCGSTAMVTLMHYAAVAVLEAHGTLEDRRLLVQRSQLATLAFSETGSRSHFWATQGTALARDGGFELSGTKSWVTAAAEADRYVWSTRPSGAEGPMSLWLVDSGTPGLTRLGSFEGLGLRGNGSVPVTAEAVRVAEGARLGPDGAGLDIALSVVLPWFLVLSASFSLGLMEAVTAETGGHLARTRLEHLDQTLLQQPLTRVDYARMRVTTDTIATLVDDTVRAVGAGREDAMLRVLESKAAAAEAALVVTDLAMKVCGGAAFRKELGVERAFRDARAARIMAPTTDALLDFIGRAVGGLPLFD